MSESYFFALCPKYLKVDHSFAKNIKPETRYKLAIFKGIQKCDQMKQQVKSKIVSGKIDFPATQLHFNIAFYNPTKNIQFHLKLYQRKPNEEEKQIGSYIISSSDYIKLFKTEQKSNFQVSGMLISDLSINFDLFVQKSKSQLNQNIQKYLSSTSINQETNNQQEDSKSQKSELSRQFVRKSDGFISPNRRLERKRSPQSRPGSRAKSINKSQKSFTSPPISPRKVQQSKKQPSKQDSKITTQEATYQYNPSNSLKFKNTNQIFDIQIENKNSSVKSPKNIQNPKLNSIEKKEEPSPLKIEVKPSPRAYQITKSTLQKSPDSRQIKSPGKFQPKRQSNVETQDFEKQTIFFPQIKISVSQNNNPKISILGTQNISQSKKETRKSGATLLNSNPQFNMQESNIRIVMEQSCVNFPVARIIDHSQQSLNLEIEEKNNSPSLLKTLEDSRDDFIKTGHWKRSIRSTELVKQQIHQEQKSKDKNFQERKMQILYAIFLLVSVFLIYNAMTPTRKV